MAVLVVLQLADQLAAMRSQAGEGRLDGVYSSCSRYFGIVVSQLSLAAPLAAFTDERSRSALLDMTLSSQIAA